MDRGRIDEWALRWVVSQKSGIRPLGRILDSREPSKHMRLAGEISKLCSSSLFSCTFLSGSTFTKKIAWCKLRIRSQVTWPYMILTSARVSIYFLFLLFHLPFSTLQTFIQVVWNVTFFNPNFLDFFQSIHSSFKLSDVISYMMHQKYFKRGHIFSKLLWLLFVIIFWNIRLALCFNKNNGSDHFTDLWLSPLLCHFKITKIF